MFEAHALSASRQDRDLSAPRELDGEAVRLLLQGAVLKGLDAGEILRGASIDPAVYGDPEAGIGGKALVRLVRRIQLELDDVYLGFFGQGCRLALEAERLLSFFHCATFGEALRVSIRFTDAMSADVGPGITEEHGSGLQHICRYHTVPALIATSWCGSGSSGSITCSAG